MGRYWSHQSIPCSVFNSPIPDQDASKAWNDCNIPLNADLGRLAPFATSETLPNSLEKISIKPLEVKKKK